ncbi:MAG: helix-turn-helix domain-containing protein [Erythrobacter sp.]
MCHDACQLAIHPPPAPNAGFPDERETLTAAALIAVDYIAPPAPLAPFATTLYHFRCDEPVIRDIQLAAIGNLCFFPHGRGEMLFAAYRAGTMSGHDCALAVGGFIGANLRRVNPRHLDLIAATGQWLAAAFNPDVSALAGTAGYSARQVQRLVERYFGLPPRALARKYRALRAATLLSAPQLSLEEEAEISEAFFDHSHMIRDIAHFVGRTPARRGDASTPSLAEMIAPTNLRELGG